MKESIHKYLKMGTLQWMSYPKETALESLRHVALDDFFDAVEVSGYANEAERQQARAISEQSHLTMALGAQPRLLAGKYNPNSIDEAERRKAEEVLIQALDEAAAIGAVGISFLAGKYTPATRQACYDALLKTTRNVCKHARDLNLQVEIELFDYDVDKCALIGPSSYAARFAAEICEEYNNFGLLLDLSHLPIMHEKSDFAVRVLRPYITHFHIGNAVAIPGCASYGDKHPRFGFPNSANNTDELLHFFRVIKREGFLNEDNPIILSIEITPQAGEDADLIMAGTKRIINRAWALLED